MTAITITRAGLSMPCSVPVVPGTPETSAPLSERTEFCAVNAYWWFGGAPTCDLHIRTALAIIGDTYEDMLADFERHHPEQRGLVPHASERHPWHEQYRYPQPEAVAAVRRLEGEPQP